MTTRAPLSPVWRGAEFQEREIFDLYGVIFDGHPDLRRILMWDEFVGFPMSSILQYRFENKSTQGDARNRNPTENAP